MPMPESKNWSEFDWERELRKDDERINSYMNELSKFIDLPGEEDIILKSLQNHSKPIHQNTNFNADGSTEEIEPFENEIFANEEWRKNDNAIIYIIVEKMASQWSLYLASKISPENMPQAMCIICHYGRLLARISDIIGVESDLPVTLKIALCKRTIEIVNELLGEFEVMKDVQSGLTKELHSHSRKLQIIREKTIDLIGKLRSESV